MSDPMTPDVKPLGPRLRALIERKGFPSVRAAASRAGVNHSQLADIIAGRKSPSVATLERIVAALGGTMAELYG
jgi:transcriptional regulator with XRE-family HTH domain